MKHRSFGQFALERVRKLLIPLIAGVLTVVALMTFLADKYHNDYAGGFIDHYSVFFTNITDLSGYDGALTPGHLWFVLFLFIISMISLPIIALQKKVLSRMSFAEIKVFWLPFLVILPLALKPILNFNGKSIGENLALYLIGFYILSEEDVMRKMTKFRYVYLAIMLIFDITLNYSFVWKGNSTAIMEIICIQSASWFGILGFLGLARCSFNQNNAFTRYMSSRSFMFYIFHFGWLVVLQYNLCKITTSTAIIFFISVFGTFAMTLATCEIVRRIPGAKLLFGEKGIKASNCRKDGKSDGKSAEKSIGE